MDKLTHLMKEFWNDEEGLTLLEYILGAALIVAAMMQLDFWGDLATVFERVSGQVAGVGSGA